MGKIAQLRKDYVEDDEWSLRKSGVEIMAHNIAPHLSTYDELKQLVWLFRQTLIEQSDVSRETQGE